MAEIILAKTAGFCFGVNRAMDIVLKEIESKTEKVFTYGPIIHNDEVVRDLEAKGIRVLESEEELKNLHEGTVIIRSHGVERRIMEICRESGLRVVDATCPFVKKIHQIVQDENAAGRRVFIVGDPGHPEVCGIKGWGRNDTEVIESAEDFCRIMKGKNEKISIVAQTTCNLNKFKEIVDKISDLGYDISRYNTICNATQERQAEAIKISSRVDVMIVIGGKHSSNTRKLVEICRKRCNNTLFIQTLDDLAPKALDSVRCVGITAGASTPKYIIEEVQNYVRTKF